MLGEAPLDAASRVRWPEFVPAMALLLATMCDPAVAAERAAVTMRSNFQPVEMMDEEDALALEQMLMGLFTQHDRDQNGSDHNLRPCPSRLAPPHTPLSIRASRPAPPASPPRSPPPRTAAHAARLACQSPRPARVRGVPPLDVAPLDAC